MLHLANSAPWYFWVLWGIVGTGYISRMVIKSTSNNPMMLRVSGMLWVIVSAIVAIDNLIKGKVFYLEYWTSVMDSLSMPLLAVTLILTYIGGYKKSIRPDFDPEKRRTFLQCSYALVATLIFFGLFFAGFYIYDNFFK